jgi:hypothetical protein
MTYMVGIRIPNLISIIVCTIQVGKLMGITYENLIQYLTLLLNNSMYGKMYIVTPFMMKDGTK